jgi:hypothetical protein
MALLLLSFIPSADQDPLSGSVDISKRQITFIHIGGLMKARDSRWYKYLFPSYEDGQGVNISRAAGKTRGVAGKMASTFVIETLTKFCV